MSPLNIRRGFNRLFLVLWMLWVVSLGAWAFAKWWDPPFEELWVPIEEWIICVAKAEEAKSAKMREECTDRVRSPWERLKRMDTWMLLVVGPLAVYVCTFTCGKLAMWTWKGFRS